MCTPYQWTKQVASHWGGTRNGTIVHWPSTDLDAGAVRSQFHHVIDIAPDPWRPWAPAPARRSTVSSRRCSEGVSMFGTLRSADAPETHGVQ